MTVHKTREAGFTLIELMIVVTLIGIAASIAFGSYKRQVAKTNRSAAQSHMFKLANKSEQYLLDARGYGTFAQLAVATPLAVSRNYTVDVTPNNAATPPSYVVSATATGTQATADARCKYLTLKSTGAKEAGPSANPTGDPNKCW